MIACDAGPLVALIDRKDPGHSRCVGAMQDLPPGSLLTTWACFTEAMHLVGRAGGGAARRSLWDLWQAGLVALHDPSPAEVLPMATLMDKYADRPMDLADASIVAMAEALGLKTIFTLDSDFRFYRLADGSALTVVPSL